EGGHREVDDGAEQVRLVDLDVVHHGTALRDGQDHLVRAVGRTRVGGAQHLVPGEHVADGLFERGHVEFAGEADGEGGVVHRGGGGWAGARAGRTRRRGPVRARARRVGG